MAKFEGSGSRVSGLGAAEEMKKKDARREGLFTLSGPVQLNRFGFYLLFSFFLTGFLSLLARFFSL